MDTAARYEAAKRLIRVATGDEFGDGDIVTEIASEYAEPGYTSDGGVIVFGDWNDKDRWEGNERVVTSTVPGRLAEALGRIGAEIEWSDEWTFCSDCYRAVRTQGDSYAWQRSYAIVDGDLLCIVCLLEMRTDALEDCWNDPKQAVTWTDGATLESYGLTLWTGNPPSDNYRPYENGWHPGQNANPTRVLEEIHAWDDRAEVVFLVDYVGQFDVGFSAYYRLPDTDEEGAL